MYGCEYLLSKLVWLNDQMLEAGRDIGQKMRSIGWKTENELLTVLGDDRDAVGRVPSHRMILSNKRKAHQRTAKLTLYWMGF